MIVLVKKFGEISGRELHDIYQLRAEVFVVEQSCPYQDVDQKDLQSVHVMLYEDDQLVAYSRLLPPGISYPEASIGRVVVRKNWRGKGIGQALTKRGIEEISQRFLSREIVISAQSYLVKFYNNFGFRGEGEQYMEDGIPHLKMRLSLN